jgi:hypothetical protein
MHAVDVDLDNTFVSPKHSQNTPSISQSRVPESSIAARQAGHQGPAAKAATTTTTLLEINISDIAGVC